MSAGRRAALLIAVIAVLGAPSALAAVSCSVSAGGVAFGTYNPLSGSPLNSTGSLTVSCTLQSGSSTVVVMTVALSAGSSASFTARTLQSGAQQLNYNLYSSAAYAQVWGDGSGGTYTGGSTLHLTPGQPTKQATLTAYGQIAAGQDVGAGSYLDTITVTVSY